MASFTQLASGSWRVQVRRKNRYVAETFRRRKDEEEWALDIERNIDRSGSPKPRAALQVRTFGDIIDLHIDDMKEVGALPVVPRRWCWRRLRRPWAQSSCPSSTASDLSNLVERK